MEQWNSGTYNTQQTRQRNWESDPVRSLLCAERTRQQALTSLVGKSHLLPAVLTHASTKKCPTADLRQTIVPRMPKWYVNGARSRKCCSLAPSWWVNHRWLGRAVQSNQQDDGVRSKAKQEEVWFHIDEVKRQISKVDVRTRTPQRQSNAAR